MTPLTLGQGQSLLALLSGMGGQSVGGLAGLIELARTRDASKAAARIKRTSEALSYTPTDPEATAMLQGAGNALGPLADGLDAAGTWAGENTASATGSPLLGSLAKLAPDVIPLDRIVSVLARAARGAGSTSPVLARMADGGGPDASGLEVETPNRRDMAAMRESIEAQFKTSGKKLVDASNALFYAKEDVRTLESAVRYAQSELDDDAVRTAQRQLAKRMQERDVWAERVEALTKERSSSAKRTRATYGATGDQIPAHPDLDMSEAARVARRDAEYIPLFHGTGESRDIGNFDKVRAGSRSGGNSARLGVWAAEDPETANAYAALRANPGSIHERNKLSAEDAPERPGDVWNYGDLGPTTQDMLGETGGTVMPLYGRPGKTYVHDFGDDGAVYGAGMLSNVVKKAWEEGYDSVQFKNIMDDPASGLYGDLLRRNFGGEPDIQNTMGDHWVFKEGNQLRTPWADFDPELKHADDLNAFNKQQPNILAALKGDARSAAINSIFNYLLAQRQQ